MRLTLEVQGLRELERELLRLDANTGVKTLRSALRAASKPMLKAAERNAPYDLDDPEGPDGYHLKDYMRLQLEPKRSRRTEAQYRLGPARLDTKNQNRRIAGGLGRGARSPNYALIAENRQPYLRPAFDNNVNGLLSDFKRLLRRRIESRIRASS